LPLMIHLMGPLLIILDDWERRIQASDCWDKVRDLVEIKFLTASIQAIPDSEIERAEFLMAVRERTSLDEALFRRMPDLKLILQTGGHAYHIDTAAAQKHKILIALGRRVKAPLVSVPELTFAFALSLMHKVHQGNQAMHNGQWPLFTGRMLSSRRLGILGMGRHGSRVAHIANTAFNMEVVAWDRVANMYDVNNAIHRLPLDELLETSDVVSIHLRLSKESTGLLNKERLEKMKPGAILINTSRGAIVDENALIEVLTSGKLAGAGLDVFTEEPLSIESPLRRLDNVILTPHIGWTAEEVFEEFAQIACTQLIEYLNGTLAESELLPY
jgi:D-3-phosphoglycerate dehydrogenase / 2-oxoglutarate reductase